jgi:hypothetical protein
VLFEREEVEHAERIGRRGDLLRMSNRMDFKNVAQEIIDYFFSEEEATQWSDLRERIETELNDAFVAGQEHERREAVRAIEAIRGHLRTRESALDRIELAIIDYDAGRRVLPPSDLAIALADRELMRLQLQNAQKDFARATSLLERVAMAGTRSDLFDESLELVAELRAKHEDRPKP